MDLNNLKEILEKHEKWLNHEDGGEYADKLKRGKK